MVNAWSLLYDEINGTLDEEYPIMTAKNENYDDFENPNPEQYNFTSSKVTEAKSDKDWQDFWKEDGISITGNPGPYDYYGEGGAFSFAGTPKFSSASSDTITLGPTLSITIATMLTMGCRNLCSEIYQFQAFWHTDNNKTFVIFL